MYNAEDYCYRIMRDDVDEMFIATVLEFPSLSNIANTQKDALIGMVELVKFVLEDMIENDEEVPHPISKHHFSGKISLRMTPEQHKRVASEAIEQGVSINQLLVSRI